MRALFIAAALLAGCMPPPPAVDPEAKMVSADEAAQARPTPSTRPSIAASGVPQGAAAKPSTSCPVSTGRRQFCEGRKICTRDQNGCEKCRCNSEMDADRARFEQTNPWDMRQR